MPAFILFYDYVADITERRGPHREAHLAHIRSAREAGHVTLAGAIGDPIHGGAIVFPEAERDSIEAFVEADPYMRAGLIEGHRVEPWHLV